MLKTGLLAAAVIAGAMVVLPSLGTAAIEATQPWAVDTAAADASRPSAARAHVRFSPRPGAVRGRVRVAQALSCESNARPMIACECLATDSRGACLQESCDTVCISTSEAGAED